MGYSTLHNCALLKASLSNTRHRHPSAPISRNQGVLEPRTRKKSLTLMSPCAVPRSWWTNGAETAVMIGCYRVTRKGRYHQWKQIRLHLQHCVTGPWCTNRRKI